MVTEGPLRVQGKFRILHGGSYQDRRPPPHTPEGPYLSGHPLP